MKNYSTLFLLSSILLLSGCSSVDNHNTTNELTVIDSDNIYIDDLGVYLSDQYIQKRKDYLSKKQLENNLVSSNIPDFEQKDFAKKTFGSLENYIKTVNKLYKIESTLKDANHIFSSLIEILDSNGFSFTNENYKYSILFREYIKYFISLIDRYIKTANNGLNTIIDGSLINDTNMINAGFKCIALERTMALHLRSVYVDLRYPLAHLIKQGPPKNLNLLFKAVAKDIPELSANLKQISTNYNEICSLITDKQSGKDFIKNKEHLENIANMIQIFLYGLIEINKICSEQR